MRRAGGIADTREFDELVRNELGLKRLLPRYLRRLHKLLPLTAEELALGLDEMSKRAEPHSSRLLLSVLEETRRGPAAS